MTKNPRYEAFLYDKVVDTDEDSTDLLRRCEVKYGMNVILSEDFQIEKEKEISPRS